MLLLAAGCAQSQADTAMVLIPAGKYRIGKPGHSLNPKRNITIAAFYIARRETTNREFAAFTAATGYITDAERRHDAMVFEPGLKEFRWLQDSTAYWRYPNGQGRGGIENKMDHPVTCISYADAIAYCKWANVRLPSLTEWEIASRAGSEDDYFFGENRDELIRYGNVWHGRDHLSADSTDGYMYTSPAGSFAPNKWGLYDVYGNVFEFCSGKLSNNDKTTVAHARGGSWWCSKNACSFFNSVDIGRVHIHASFSNQGFRIAKDKS